MDQKNDNEKSRRVYIWISLLESQLLAHQCPIYFDHVQVDSKLTNLRTTLGALRKSRSLCSSCSSSSPPSSVSPPGWQSSASFLSFSTAFICYYDHQSQSIRIFHLHSRHRLQSRPHLHFCRLFSPRAARWRLMWCGKYLQQSQLKNLLHTLNN